MHPADFYRSELFRLPVTFSNRNFAKELSEAFANYDALLSQLAGNSDNIFAQIYAQRSNVKALET